MRSDEPRRTRREFGNGDVKSVRRLMADTWYIYEYDLLLRVLPPNSWSSSADTESNEIPLRIWEEDIVVTVRAASLSLSPPPPSTLGVPDKCAYLGGWNSPFRRRLSFYFFRV